MKNTLTRFETSSATSPGTQTHKVRYEKIKEAITQTANQTGFQIKSQNDTYKEMLLVKRSVEIIVKITNPTIMESTVDLTVMTPIFTSGKKVASAFFEILKRNIT